MIRSAMSPAPATLRITRLGTTTRDRLDRAPERAGSVHSVFERAVNVLWHDGRLVTLHGPGALEAPFAVALSRLPERGALTAGMPIARCAIDWRDAECIGLDMPEGALGFAPGALPQPPPAAALGSSAGLGLLARGLATRDANTVAMAALALVGLGEGLTPSGDDCLVGALSAIHRLAPAWLARSEGLRAWLAAAAESGTTAIAHGFLLEALEGRFAEPVLAVLTAESDASARLAALRLLAMGATSGADTLCGIWLACQALAPRP